VVSEHPTIATGIEVDHVTHADVDNSQEALVLLLELLLVKDLNCQNTVFCGSPDMGSVGEHACCSGDIHIKHFIPVWVECFLYDRGRARLLTPNRGDGKWIGKSWAGQFLVQDVTPRDLVDSLKTSLLYKPSAAMT
jgi:hypothetical protein